MEEGDKIWRSLRNRETFLKTIMGEEKKRQR